MSKSKNNKSGKPIWLTFLGFIGLSLVIALLLKGNDVALLNPKGTIADEEQRLLLVATAIMLAFGIPVLFLLYFFAWRYREGNQKAVYKGHSSNSKLFNIILWAIPTSVMLVLASLMLPATQELEPKRAIESENEQLIVQVVALRWKWLFMYPDQGIATVNFVQIPVDTPVRFELTADEAPMNSFWIPHLGGMLYAMTEHVNPLNLMADTVGDYEGSAAEINGAGFAGMRFLTRVSTQEDFDKWVQVTKASTNELSASGYDNLLEPSKDNPVAFYSNTDPGIFSNILSKYSGGSHEHYIESEGH